MVNKTISTQPSFSQLIFQDFIYLALGTAAGKRSRRLTDELVFPSVLMQTLYWSTVAKRELSEAVDFLDDVHSYPHLSS